MLKLFNNKDKSLKHFLCFANGKYQSRIRMFMLTMFLVTNIIFFGLITNTTSAQIQLVINKPTKQIDTIKYYNKIESNYSCTGNKEFVAEYGSKIKDTPYGFGGATTSNIAFGCSTWGYYCNGSPKSLPCCTHIAYLMWYKLEDYLIKYNISYSLRWGSMLFAVRDGKHAPWDNRDIDIGFMYPVNKAKIAVNEFINDYNLSLRGHHMTDENGIFYKLYHKKYGYPNGSFCFINEEFTLEYQNFNYIQTISFHGFPFLDLGFGIEGLENELTGMEILNKNISNNNIPLIPVNYDGPNNLKPPRNLYVYFDYYKTLDKQYPKWRNGLPHWISKQQLNNIHNYKWNQSYFKHIKQLTTKAVGNQNW